MAFSALPSLILRSCCRKFTVFCLCFRLLDLSRLLPFPFAIVPVSFCFSGFYCRYIHLSIYPFIDFFYPHYQSHLPPPPASPFSFLQSANYTKINASLPQYLSPLFFCTPSYTYLFLFRFSQSRVIVNIHIHPYPTTMNPNFKKSAA